MAAGTFDCKAESVPRRSPIGMTRRLADENEWARRSAMNAERKASVGRGARVGHGPTSPRRHVAQKPSQQGQANGKAVPGSLRTPQVQMVLNVAGALLSLDPANRSEMCPEKRFNSNVQCGQQLTLRHPPSAGTLTMLSSGIRAMTSTCCTHATWTIKPSDLRRAMPSKHGRAMRTSGLKHSFEEDSDSGMCEIPKDAGVAVSGQIWTAGKRTMSQWSSPLQSVG